MLVVAQPLVCFWPLHGTYRSGAGEALSSGYLYTRRSLELDRRGRRAKKVDANDVRTQGLLQRSMKRSSVKDGRQGRPPIRRGSSVRVVLYAPTFHIVPIFRIVFASSSLRYSVECVVRIGHA